MTRFEDAVQHDLSAAPQPAPLRRLQRLTRRRRARRLVVGAVPLLVVVVGVGLLVRPTGHSSSVSVHPTVTQPTFTPTTINHGGSEVTTPPAAALTSSRIELSATTVVGGASISAVVVVENNTGRAIRASGCISLFQVALTSPAANFEPRWNRCLQIFTIPVGESRYPVRVIATYSECVQGKPQGAVKSCLSNGQAPPLPAGDYRAVLDEPANAIALAPARIVRVTAG